MARSNGQPNFKTLIRDELVNRFESVIIDEINNYKSSVSKTDEEIKEIINLIDKIFYHLDINKAEQKNKDFRTKEEFKSINKKLEYSHSEQNRKIYESAHEINLAKLSVSDGLDRISTKQEIVYFKESISKDIDKIKQFAIDQDKICNYKLSKLFEEHKKIFHESFFVYNHEFEELKKDIEKLKTQIALFFVETDGVKKEIDVVKKDLFIMEKKIENLYTLVSRVNKRLDSCPKPD